VANQRDLVDPEERGKVGLQHLKVSPLGHLGRQHVQKHANFAASFTHHRETAQAYRSVPSAQCFLAPAGIVVVFWTVFRGAWCFVFGVFRIFLEGSDDATCKRQYGKNIIGTCCMDFDGAGKSAQRRFEPARSTPSIIDN
jgi:hypothetical protein